MSDKPDPKPKAQMTLGESFMAWRRERVTAAFVDTHSILDHAEPFGEAFEEWHRLKQQMEPGDELWTFCSPAEEWDNHMGWQGLVLVRDGNLFDFCISAQN
jgi:hypothetical protein